MLAEVLKPQTILLSQSYVVLNCRWLYQTAKIRALPKTLALDKEHCTIYIYYYY